MKKKFKAGDYIYDKSIDEIYLIDGINHNLYFKYQMHSPHNPKLTASFSQNYMDDHFKVITKRQAFLMPKLNQI